MCSIIQDYYNNDYDYFYWLLLLIILLLISLLLYTIDLFLYTYDLLTISCLLSMYNYWDYYSYYFYILDNYYSNSESYISSKELRSIDLSKQSTILFISYYIDLFY